MKGFRNFPWKWSIGKEPLAGGKTCWRFAGADIFYLWTYENSDELSYLEEKALEDDIWMNKKEFKKASKFLE